MAVRTERISALEAAELINVSAQTIRRWCKDGLFHTAQQIGAGKMWVIGKNEIISYGEYYHSTEFEDKGGE